MSRVLITGATDGIGLATARSLMGDGHEVVVHARTTERARESCLLDARPFGLIVGDLSSARDVVDLAEQANELGRFDAVIHNAAVGFREPETRTVDGIEQVLAVNVLAPYALTALIEPPSRLVYLSSRAHRDGEADISDLNWLTREWDPEQAYRNSKLYITTLAMAAARLWPNTISNAVEPGWVPTRMGGSGAPDDIELAHVTQAWLSVSHDPEALVTGGYFFRKQQLEPAALVRNIAFQGELLSICERHTGLILGKEGSHFDRLRSPSGPRAEGSFGD
jgi:NAD(P)-dependent dehydrogenase (short-subunit alcohol dehydrogenase family)